MTSRYRHHDVILFRSTTDPGDIDLPPDLDFTDAGALHGEGRDWLVKLWARDDVREALTLASPGLAARISQLTAAGTQPVAVRDLRRAFVSAAGYVLRWKRRVTPFGLFAGVMPAAIGPAEARFGTAHRVVARADAGWLAAVTESLEGDPVLRPRLTVIANNMAAVRDGRLVVTRRTAAGAQSPGPLREASARCTRPALAAMELAARPVLFAGLAGELAARFPTASPDQIRALLDGLLDEGFLVSGMRAPASASDPLAWLIRALRDAGAQHLPGTAATVLSGLEEARDLLDAHNAGGGAARAAVIRSAAAGRMASLCRVPQHPLAVDVRLDGRVNLSSRVVDEAVAAAEVLLRMTTRPFGSPAWMDYQMRFRERYGPGALVPVRDLVADSGLGYPDGYLGALRQRPAWRAVTERDAALLALIQQALLSGAREIRLTESDVQALTTGDHASLVSPPHVEIGVTLSAESAAAIGRGEFELRVVAAPRAATSMAGRFAYLLTGGERERLAATWPADHSDSDTVTVQVSFPPRTPRSGNVTRVAPLVPDVLALGEHPAGGGAVSVDDLAVTADAAQMYLVHRPTMRRVVPFIPHALDLPRHTPPLARFIAEVADARSAGYGPFDPGAARVLPYVPRIRYRRTILAPARWLLHRDDLKPRPGESTGWVQRLAGWRDQWQVPARVELCHGELRLPLDLDRALDRHLLRTQLERAQRVELREDAPPDGNGWLGRPAELLIPLALAEPPPRHLPVTGPPGQACRPGRSPLLCARITGNPLRFDDIIAVHLPRLAVRLDGAVERWWVRRYRDLIHLATPQRIDVYLRLAEPDDFAVAAAELAGFAAELESLALPGQLALASFTEHPARYGHGEALGAAEEVFAADTAAAIAQITVAASGVSGQALAAASMTRLAAAFAPDPASGCAALTRCLEQGSGPLDRAARDQACQLADPGGASRALRALPGGDDVATAWGRRDTALAAYHQALSAQRDPGTVLRTLLHEHHIRALGLDPDVERQTGRLARAAAMRQLALAGRT